MDLASVARQLLEWIKSCDELHGGTCQASSMTIRSVDHIPHWVIDIEQACIVPGSSVPRYVALSYVWPDHIKGTERLILERGNVHKLQQPGALLPDKIKHLPLAVREAFDLLRAAEERYLWVDCLCILQHDEETQSQTDAMNNIYSGAYFTIIAAPSVGLFGSKPCIEKRSHCPETAKEHYDCLMRSNWATRGWTFQEQILSKRAVVFLNSFEIEVFDQDSKVYEDSRRHIFWDCQIAIWAEQRHNDEKTLSVSKTATQFVSQRRSRARITPRLPLGPSSLQKHSLEKWAGRSWRHLSRVPWPDFGAYLEAVCLYNSRDLTYPQDVLVAVAGVLNDLGYPFPGGFVGGLPQAFIDETLAWQPYSKATRRVNVTNTGIAPHRHLPSWSWCGWKCCVDPVSFATGLDYSLQPMHESHRKSWRTHKLVDWSIVSAELEHTLVLSEAGLLARCKSIVDREDLWSLQGWHRATKQMFLTESVQYFAHTSSDSARFRYPLPIQNDPNSSPKQINWPFLSCSTTRCWLRVRCFMICSDMSRYRNSFTRGAPLKTSVFDLRQWTESPGTEAACSVISLEDGDGHWAGVLRVMDTEEQKPGESLELIAISHGEVSYHDLARSAFEECVDHLHRYKYPYGKDGAVDHYRWSVRSSTTAHGQKTETRSHQDPHHSTSSGIPPTSMAAQSRPKALLEAFGLTDDPYDGDSDDSVPDSHDLGQYHYYNVLWIEWRGKIAYRRAAGRIRKDIWEKNCGDPVKIILG